MITFIDTYNNRKKEIENFLELMEFLEKKENDRQNGISKFGEFFYSKESNIHLTYQSLINILKSNISLMIYSIIEYTVTNLIDTIYDEIRLNNLSYTDVNQSIKELWRKTILKAINDPNANFNTFLRKNEEIISMILNHHTLNMYSRNTLPAGNLDGNSIKEIFAYHGIQIKTNSSNYRPDILQEIKENRNNLSHGSISFIEAVREDSLIDIRQKKIFVITFLDELIDTVSFYITNQKYKTS